MCKTFLFLVLVLLAVTIGTKAQNDTVNQIDHNGLKQGYWTKNYRQNNGFNKSALRPHRSNFQKYMSGFKKHII